MAAQTVHAKPHGPPPLWCAMNNWLCKNPSIRSAQVAADLNNHKYGKHIAALCPDKAQDDGTWLPFFPAEQSHNEPLEIHLKTV